MNFKKDQVFIQTEKEFKCKLTKEQYSLLLTNKISETLINNYYFTALNKSDSTVRIRRYQDNYELTVKTGCKSEGDVSFCNEHTIFLSQAEAADKLENGISSELISKLSGERLSDFLYAAQNEVHRSIIRLGEIQAELDMCKYYTSCDYELECEDVTVLDELKSELAKRGIKPQKPNSKYARTIAREKDFMLDDLDCVLFDLDGTLLKTDKAIIPCLKKTFEIMNIPVSGDYYRFIGPPLIDTMYELFPDKNRAAEAAATYLRIYSETKAESNIQPYNGINELLIYLKSKGLKIGVATSKLQSAAESCIDRACLYTDFIVGADKSKGVAKKSEVIDCAVERYGLKRDKTILIGDTIYDLEGAASCGIYAAAVGYGYGKKGYMRFYPHLGFFDTVYDIRNFFEKRRRP